ncbi:MAG TPA: ABC transporter permease [Vicinamibacterales bacterium]|jgi:predicted permease|nr:ABC transporter permease [Vicinamibacterales bacterium]
MDTVAHDVRYALRSLARQPWFSALAILTLSLGIGANAAIFSVVNAVLLRPLAYPDADRIVAITTDWRKTGIRGQASGPDFHDWHDTSTSFNAMAYYVGGETSVSVARTADYANAVRVTPEFFNVFGVAPEAGRLPEPAEQTAGGPMTAVVGHDFALRRFGQPAAAVGATVTVAEFPLTVIGVMPPGFGFPGRTDVWGPSWLFAETTSRSAHNYLVVAKLKPGTSVEQAQAQMTGIAARLEREYPKSNEGKGAAVVPLQERLVGSTKDTLYLLLGAVALVLLIACANVSNLLLTRATTRTGELGVRAALGASRVRLIRQLITESLVLALVSSIGGVLLASWGVRALVALAPAGLPRLAEVRIDAEVLTFALAASAVASLLFGVTPAMQASRVDLNTSLRQGGRGALAIGGARLRSALVVIEIALAVALVVGAGLLIRSFLALGGVDLGYSSDRVLVAETAVPAKDLDSAKRATAFYASVRAQLAALPGVQSVAGVRGLPSTPSRSSGGYWVEGGPGPETLGILSPQALFTVATPDYFKTMSIPLRRGRDFSEGDRFDAPFVVIVNEAFVRQSFPGRDPIGHRIACGLDSPNFMTIVGVVGDVRTIDPSRAPQPELYMPFEQHPRYATALTLVARTAAADPSIVAPSLGEVIRRANADVPVRTNTMTSTLSTSVATPRFRTLLVGAFAALALCLAMAGVYGVMAYTVERRTAEIGVRLALGAASRDILTLVLKQGLLLASAGIVCGCALALAVTRLLAGMLFGVTAVDPLVFAAAPLLLLTSAIAACAAPALRASRVDPMIALRAE